MGFNVHAAVLQNFFDVWRDPAAFVPFFSGVLDAVTAHRVAVQQVAFGQALERRLGPVRIIAITSFAAGTPADFLRADEVIAPGLEKMNNFTLVGIHGRSLQKILRRVEQLAGAPGRSDIAKPPASIYAWPAFHV